jgi:N-carbamoylputrescine amidase
VSGDVGMNLDHAERLVREAAARGARFVVLPELYALFPAARDAAGADAIRKEASDADAPLKARMLALAAELDVNIAVGRPELRNGRLYNTMLFVEPGGIAGSYAKRWLLSVGPEKLREAEVFAPGGEAPVLDWGGVRVGVMICADGGNDPLWKRTITEGAQIVLWPSSGPRVTRLKAPTPVERARAEEVPVAFINRSRPDEAFPLIYGGSEIVNASGGVLAQADDEADAILVADVPLRQR